MTRIEEIRDLYERSGHTTNDELKELWHHIDTQAAELASLKQQVERLRGALEHIGNRSASPWVQKDCASALAADGERGG